MANDIIVYKNRTHTFQLALTSGGSAWDISTATAIVFTCKLTEDDTEIFSCDGSPTGDGIAWGSGNNGTDGLVNVTIDDSDTEDNDIEIYLWACDVTIGGEEYQAMHGSLHLKQPVKA